MIIVVYFLLHVIRIVIVIAAIPLYPLFGHEDKFTPDNSFKHGNSPIIFSYLLRAKHALTNPNIIFLSWGGLRGAVSMALALALLQSSISGEINCSEEDGRKLFTLVGGVAFLTLLINATTSKMLLEKLELIVVSSDEIETVRNYARKRIYQKLATLVSKIDNIYEDVYPYDILQDVKEQLYNDRLRVDRAFTARKKSVAGAIEAENVHETSRNAFTNSFFAINSVVTSKNNLTSPESQDSLLDTGVKQRLKKRSDSIYTQRRPSLVPESLKLKLNGEVELGKIEEGDEDSEGPNSVRNDADFDIDIPDQYTPVKGGEKTDVDNDGDLDSRSSSSPFNSHHHMHTNLQKDDGSEHEIGVLTSNNLFKHTMSAPVVADSATPQRTKLNQKLLMEVRVSFLEVLRSTYWRHINQNFFPRNSLAATVLLSSIDFAQDNVYTDGFKDWRIIEDFMNNSLSWILRVADFTDYIIKLLGLAYLKFCKCNITPPTTFRERFEESHVSNCIYILTSYIKASHEAQEKIPYYMGDTSHADTPEEKLVIAESIANVEIAKNVLENISSEIKIKCLVRQTERYVTWKQEQMIEEFQEEGIILERDAEVLLEESLFDHNNSKNAEWLQKLF